MDELTIAELPSLGEILRRIPLTLTIAVVLIGVALRTRTHRASLAEVRLHDYGYAPRHFWQGEWRRIVTSVFVTAGGAQFYASLAAAAIFVGTLEWNVGSGLTALCFFVSHTLTLMIEALLIVAPLRRMGFRQGETWHFTPDIGPSAGYYGCFGAVVAICGWSGTIIVLIVSFLALRVLVRLIYPGSDASGVTADIAHFVAFALGLAGGFLWLA